MLALEILQHALARNGEETHLSYIYDSSIAYKFLLFVYPLCFYRLTLLFLVQGEIINLDHINQFEGRIR